MQNPDGQKSCQSAAFLFASVSIHILKGFLVPEICVSVRGRLRITKRAKQNSKIQANPSESQDMGLYKGFYW